jgi:hypothetical protein
MAWDRVVRWQGRGLYLRERAVKVVRMELRKNQPLSNAVKFGCHLTVFVCDVTASPNPERHQKDAEGIVPFVSLHSCFHLPGRIS